MNEKLIEFISKRTHLGSGGISPRLRLAEDIGLYGLDAVGFFEEFFEEFQITNIQQFDADLHIDGGPDFAPRPLKRLKDLFVPERRKYLRPDVTMGHLQKVLEKGEWFNER